MIRYAAELLGKSLLKKLTGLRYSEYLKTGQIAFIIEFLLTISVQNVFFFFLWYSQAREEKFNVGTNMLFESVVHIILWL